MEGSSYRWEFEWTLRNDPQPSIVDRIRFVLIYFSVNFSAGPPTTRF